VILLENGDHFIAQNAWNSLALYRVADGSLIHAFPAPTRIGPIALSLDEQHLLVTCTDGSLLLWHVATGERIWFQKPRATDIKYPYDASFAGNGGRFVVCDEQDKVVVFDTLTGLRIGTISFPLGQTTVISATLNPEGTRGFLIVLGGWVSSFEVDSGQPVDTGLRGAWPIRFSSTGKHIAFRSCHSGRVQQLSVVAVADQLTRRDLGEYTSIGAIRPTRDGNFLVTAYLGKEVVGTTAAVGVMVCPENGSTEEIWRVADDAWVNEQTDFSLGGTHGVSTDWLLITRLIDLRTGKVVRELDNSENARPEMVSTSYFGRSWLGYLLLCVCFVFVMVRVRNLLWRWRRSIPSQ
jgi:hypothetical protein